MRSRGQRESGHLEGRGLILITAYLSIINLQPPPLPPKKADFLKVVLKTLNYVCGGGRVMHELWREGDILIAEYIFIITREVNLSQIILKQLKTLNFV